MIDDPDNRPAVDVKLDAWIKFTCDNCNMKCSINCSFADDDEDGGEGD